jgi:ubiquinone/menaquinone biosynthesis C-methylase UbiE
MSISQKSATYTHGHHESVLRSHTWRTATNSAAYLLPHLKPYMKILDVGCGPGTITIDLATLVPQGKVIGLEYAPTVLDQARATATQRGVTNINFEVGDVHNLKYEDDTFDIVHAHQVLQHVADPIQALKEMRRVTKPGGIVAVRDVNFSSICWYPETDGMKEWHETYLKVARGNGGDPDAGRKLHAWARKAGFDRSQVTASASCWLYCTPEERHWWSELWADRTVASSFRDSALKHEDITEEDLQGLARAWRKWGREEDGWICFMNGEILCRK